MSRCTPIFLLMYIYFYIYDLANKQTKMSQMIWHTKKSEQPTKGRSLRLYLCLFIIFYASTSENPSFIIPERVYEVIGNVRFHNIVRILQEMSARCLDISREERFLNKHLRIQGRVSKEPHISSKEFFIAPHGLKQTEGKPQRIGLNPAVEVSCIFFEDTPRPMLDHLGNKMTM